MRFSCVIPQPKYEKCSWDTFLQKAAKGSYKAVDVLNLADLEVFTASKGMDLNPVDLVPGRTPFETFQAFVTQLIEDGLATDTFNGKETAIHERSHYDALWRRSKVVDEDDLLHDAAIHAFRLGPLKLLAKPLVVRLQLLDGHSRSVRRTRAGREFPVPIAQAVL